MYFFLDTGNALVKLDYNITIECAFKMRQDYLSMC